MAAHDDKLMTVAEVAGKAAVSEKTVRRAIWRGELIASKLCNRLRIPPQAFDDWIARGRVVVVVEQVEQVAPVAPDEPGSLSRLRAMEDAA